MAGDIPSAGTVKGGEAWEAPSRSAYALTSVSSGPARGLMAATPKPSSAKMLANEAPSAVFPAPLRSDATYNTAIRAPLFQVSSGWNYTRTTRSDMVLFS